jgi:hypothetical protein
MDEAEQAATASTIVTSPPAPASALFLGLCPDLDACRRVSSMRYER